MPTILRREQRACPICALPLTVLHKIDGPTIEYDVAEWARLCRHPNCGSPLACPSLEPLIRGWLGKCQIEPPA